MQPKSTHWADQTAFRIVKQCGELDTYVVASGVTPSGTAHIGNFREVITVDMVARALRDLGKTVRSIHSWDDFDTLRKVPQNLPNQEMLKENLRRPINRVPDAYGEEESYARANEVRFERELAKVGVDCEFLYQGKMYESGVYAEHIRTALQNTPKIREILNKHRKTPLADDWLPTAIYCETCDRDEVESQSYDGDWGYSYRCTSCKKDITVDIRETKNLKLNWRTDWPMRWFYEKVDFEPGGKDHSTEGGSYDTGKEIIKSLWDRDAPIYLQYDFVLKKGVNGKISSSVGDVFTLSDAYEVYTPQMVRWIFANQRANHDFSIAFDEDVIKTFDEFDRAEATALGPQPDKPGRWPIVRRTYELSVVDGSIPDAPPFRPGFRLLCNRLQVCDGDIERTRERFYRDETKDAASAASYEERANLAWNWLDKFAPDDFRYKINGQAVDLGETPEQAKALEALRELIAASDLDAIEAKELNQKLYDDVIHKVGCDAKPFFQLVYQKLISRDRGPRLPSFLKEIGQERLLNLL